MAEDDYCYLTTTGRTTGQTHEIEIWYERDAEAPATLLLLAGAGRGSDWVRNLEQSSAATVRFGTDPTIHRVSGRVLDGETDESRRARDLVFAKYQARSAGDLSDWRERSIPVALDPA